MLNAFGLVPVSIKSIQVGARFGKLVVLAVGKIPDTYRYTAVCQCDCESPPRAVRGDHLLGGKIVGCGCVQKERSRTHGLSKSPHYDRWRHMMDRCYDPDCLAFPDYGGRGIRVCDRWHDLSTFVAELPEGYFRGAEIDRIDNDRGYEPGNVRWVTRSKNLNNKRSNRRIEFCGRTQTLSEWAAEFELDVRLVHNRITYKGWSVERALTTPPMNASERMAIARAAQSAA